MNEKMYVILAVESVTILYIFIHISLTSTLPTTTELFTKTIYTQRHLLIMWCDSVGGAYSDSKIHFLFPWWQKYWPTSILLLIFFRAQTATSSELQGNDLLCYCECVYPAVQISCPLNYLTLIYLWCIVIGPSRLIMYERCQ